VEVVGKVSEDDCEDGDETFGKDFAMSTILKRPNGVDVAVVEIVLEAGLVSGSGDVEVETLQPTRLEVIASTVLEDFKTSFSMAGVPIDGVSGAEASRTDRVRDETRALAHLLIMFRRGADTPGRADPTAFKGTAPPSDTTRAGAGEVPIEVE
jgi:hypothetical protein